MPKFTINLDVELEANNKFEATKIMQATMNDVLDNDDRLAWYWLGEVRDTSND